MNKAASPARKSACICLAFITFLTATYHLGLFAAGILCAVFTLTVCFCVSRRIGAGISALLVAAAAFGYFSMSLFTSSQNAIRESYAGKSAYITAYAEDCTVKSGHDSICLRVETVGKTAAPYGFRVIFNTAVGSGISAGDRVSGYFTFSQIDDKDGFPSKLYFDGEAVSLFAYSCSYKSVPLRTFRGFFADMRSFITERFSEYLPKTSGLAGGIMLGDKSGVSDDEYGMLSANGITHILCVSGLHVNILISAVAFVLSKMRISKRAKRFVICFFAFFYMALTGFTLSVCRAGIMAAVAVCDDLTRRRPDPMTSLLLTAALLCLFEPQNVINLSFRLSFLATAGVITAGQNIIPAINRRLGRGVAAKICSYILDTEAFSVCAVAVCVPVISVYIGKQSALSPMGNLVCAPIAELYLILCFLLIPISFVPFVGARFGAATDLVGRLFLRLSELLAKSAYFLDISSPVLAAVSLALVAVLLLCYVFDVKDRTRISFGFAAASIALMLVSSL